MSGGQLMTSGTARFLTTSLLLLTAASSMLSCTNKFTSISFELHRSFEIQRFLVSSTPLSFRLDFHVLHIYGHLFSVAPNCSPVFLWFASRWETATINSGSVLVLHSADWFPTVLDPSLYHICSHSVWQRTHFPLWYLNGSFLLS